MLDTWRSDRAELCTDRRRHYEDEARAGARTPAHRLALIVRLHYINVGRLRREFRASF